MRSRQLFLFVTVLLTCFHAGAHDPPTSSVSTASSPPGQALPKEVVLAAFQTIGGTNPLYLVPFLSYSSNQYTFLPREEEARLAQQVASDDYLPSGAENPNSSLVKDLKRKSIFSSIMYFDVYRRGKKVGSYTVRDIAFVGPFAQVVGTGLATGFTPGYDDIAVANGPLQQNFWMSPSSLSPTQTARLNSMVTSLFPGNLPTNQVLPAAVGKPLSFRVSSQNVSIMDLPRDRSTEIAVERKAKVQWSFPVSLNASAFLLTLYDNQKQSFDKLLSCSWATAPQGEIDLSGNGYCALKGALDINGDGVPELILISGGSEFAELFAYEVRDGKLHLIGTRTWTLGFELK